MPSFYGKHKTRSPGVVSVMAHAFHKPVFASRGGVQLDSACAVAKLSAWNYGCSTIIIIDADDRRP
ncbi:MAG: hypothetical protein ACLQBD_20360 [Syntrophobacteraceae bacterium]